jgi:pimeloyl-ACP methyl ester carboxylesterase
MREAPHTHYTRNGDANIAYQVVGDGPIDLFFVQGWFSHLDYMWEMPASREFFGGLARFSRLITYDKRGTGLSDPVERAGSYADRFDDMRAVMDAAETERPVICGLSEGGIISALFARHRRDARLAWRARRQLGRGRAV